MGQGQNLLVWYQAPPKLHPPNNFHLSTWGGHIYPLLFPLLQDAHELLSQCLDQLQDDLNQLNKTTEESRNVSYET